MNALETNTEGMRKILFVMLLFLLVMPMISAFEFDNIYNYNLENKTAEIKNTIGIADLNFIIAELDTIAEVKMLNEKSIVIDIRNKDVCEKYEKGEGINCRIGEFKINPKKDNYKDPIKNFESYNLNKEMKEVSKVYTFKEKIVVGQKLVQDYSEVPVCNVNKQLSDSNKTIILDCKKELIGEHYENIYNYVEVDLDNLDKETTIAFYTNVKNGEHIEVIFEAYGARVEEWYDYVGLTKYERYEEAMDTVCNGGGTWFCGQGFTIGSTGANEPFYPQGLTVYWGTVNDGTTVQFAYTNSTGGVPVMTGNLTSNNTVSVSSANSNKLFNVTFPIGLPVDTGTQYNFYYHPSATAELQRDSSGSYGGGQLVITSNNGASWITGGYENDDLWFQVWGSLGDNAPDVSLNATPTDGANISLGDLPITLFANATDDNGLLNGSLFINGILNYTEYNTTNAQLQLNVSTSLSFNKASYNWSAFFCDTNDQCTMTSNKTFTITDNFPYVSLNATPTEAQEILLTDNVSLKANSTDDIAMLNISLFINGILNYTEYNTSSNQINLNVSRVYTLPLGTYNWSAYGCDSSNQCTITANKTFIKVDHSPEISLNATPIDGANFTFNQISLKANGTDDNALLNVSLWINGELNYTEYNTTFNQKQLNVSTVLTFSDGSYNWSADACHISGGCNHTNNKTFTIDSTFPQVDITYPLDLSTITDNLAQSNITVNINYTFVEANPNNCFYYNNTANVSMTCGNNISFGGLPYGNYLHIVYINDTFGNLNSSSVNVTYDSYVTENSRTYTPQTTEGNLEDFSVNVTIKSGITITGSRLNYDSNNSHVGSNNLVGNDYIIDNTNVFIPQVASNVNKTFFWELFLSNGVNVNLSTSNQSVLALDIDDCSVYSNVRINMTVYEEESQKKITNNTVIETAVNIYSQDRSTLLLNISLNSTSNPLSICLNINLLNVSQYSLDSVIRYEATGFAKEYYNIVDLNLTNNTALQNIFLYDLNSSDSTEFQLTFIGNDFLPTENALIYVDRQYIPENIFKTVELPKTDSNGQTVLHLVRNDVIYNIRVIKDNQILGNFENIIAFCQDYTIGDCRIDLDAFDSTEGIFNYDQEIGIIISEPTYNETTGRIIFDFSTTDGSTKTVNMSITRNDIFGNRSLCSQTVVSSGGSLFCDIDPDIDETTIKATFIVDGEELVQTNIVIDSENYGAGGYIVLFALILCFILMFSESKVGVLIGVVLGIATGIGMGMLSSSMIGLGASGLWILIIAGIGIWKINKDREQ